MSPHEGKQEVLRQNMPRISTSIPRAKQWPTQAFESRTLHFRAIMCNLLRECCIASRHKGLLQGDFFSSLKPPTVPLPQFGALRNARLHLAGAKKRGKKGYAHKNGSVFARILSSKFLLRETFQGRRRRCLFPASRLYIRIQQLGFRILSHPPRSQTSSSAFTDLYSAGFEFSSCSHRRPRSTSSPSGLAVRIPSAI